MHFNLCCLFRLKNIFKVYKMFTNGVAPCIKKDFIVVLCILLCLVPQLPAEGSEKIAEKGQLLDRVVANLSDIIFCPFS